MSTNSIFFQFYKRNGALKTYLPHTKRNSLEQEEVSLYGYATKTLGKSKAVVSEKANLQNANIGTLLETQ